MMRTGRALQVQAALWRGGQIRAVGFPDLLVAAVAERERVTVLHYDAGHTSSRRSPGSQRSGSRPRDSSVTACPRARPLNTLIAANGYFAGSEDSPANPAVTGG